MFKICMKNYFANLKYVFVALGVMFIALIVGAQAMVNKSVREINTMVASIEDTTESSDLSFEEVGESISGTFDAIIKNLSPEVITGKEEQAQVEKSIGEAISDVVENYFKYFGEIVTFLAKAIAGIIVAIIIFLLIQVLGVFTSSTLITIFGRFDIANDNVLKIILEQLVRVLFVIVWMWMIVGVFFLNTTVGIIVAALFPLVYCYIALLGVWVTAGKDKRPKYTEYASFIHVLVLLACNLLQILIGAAIAAIAFLLGGVIVAAVFGIALLILAVANVNINAYAFLYKMPQIQKAIEENTEIIFTEDSNAAVTDNAGQQIVMDAAAVGANAEEIKPAAEETTAAVTESAAETVPTAEAPATEPVTEAVTAAEAAVSESTVEAVPTTEAQVTESAAEAEETAANAVDIGESDKNTAPQVTNTETQKEIKVEVPEAGESKPTIKIDVD